MSLRLIPKVAGAINVIFLFDFAMEKRRFQFREMDDDETQLVVKKIGSISIDSDQFGGGASGDSGNKKNRATFYSGTMSDESLEFAY